MITLYLDMDGVLCNFIDAYYRTDSKPDNTERFRDSVMVHKIFEDLDFMPKGTELLSYVEKLCSESPCPLNVQILTSVGTLDVVQGAEAQRQKLHWLRKHGITYPVNFSRNAQEKSNYATPFSILVDDTPECINHFDERGGCGILYRDTEFSTCVQSLSKAVELMAR